MDRWDRLDEIIAQVEQLLVAVLLSLMIVVAFLQIVLRNVFFTGLSWGDPVVRYMVLWVGFIGASIATKEGRHINIDVLSRFVPGLGNILIQGIGYSFSSFVCGILTFAALKFIRNEAQIGGITFLGIPAWVPGLIIPGALGIMTMRFGLRSLKTLSTTTKLGSTPDQQIET